MASEIGTAYIRVRPDTKGFQQETQRTLLPTLKKTAAALGVGFAVFKGFQFAKDAVIDFNAQLEQSRIAFATMLKSGKKADKMLQDLGTFAKTTPFEFQELVPLAQRLLATGTSADDVIPKLKLFGDTVSALGGGATEMNMLIRATSQLAARGKANLGDLYQITNLGIPIFQKMAEQTGQSVGKLMESISKGEVPAEVALKSLFDMAQKDYGGAMEKQSHTFIGAMSNIHDAIQLALADLGKPFFDAISQAAQRFSAFLAELQKAPNVKVGIQMTLEGIAGIARNFWDELSRQIKGFTESHPIKALSGKTIGFSEETTQPLGQRIASGIAAGLALADWGSVAQSIVDGLTKALAGASELGAAMAKAMAEGLIANRGMIAEAAVLILAEIVLTITDPAFWLSHWEILLALLLTFFGDGLVGGLFKVGGAAARALFGGLGGRLLPMLDGLLRPIVSFFARVGTQAGARLGGLAVSAFRAAWNRLPGIVSGIAQRAFNLFMAVVNRIGPMVVRLFSFAIQNVIVLFVSLARTIAGRVGGAIQGVVRKITGMPGTIRRGASEFLGWLTAINVVVGAVETLIGKVKDLINWISNIDWPSPPSLSDLNPFHSQHGQRDFVGGLSMVGEAGPELAFLPSGSDVFTAGETRNILRGLAAGVDRFASVRPVSIGHVSVHAADANAMMAQLNRLAWGLG